jgi:lon-related putative ATP-dependent protease
MTVSPLLAKQLYCHCPADWLPFGRSDELSEEAESFGQDRALQAIEFAVGMPHDGYNLYVAGSTGLGKHALLEQRLRQWSGEPVSPQELCYIHNFEAPHKPKALLLPPGTARQLQQDMLYLLEYLFSAIPEIFKSDEYHARREEIKLEFQEREEEAFKQLTEHARELSVGLARTPSGYAIGPFVNDKHLGPDEFSALPVDDQQRIKKNIETINGELKKTIRQAPKWQEEFTKNIKALNEEFVHLVVDERIFRLRKRYEKLEQALAFIENVYRDVIENADDFRHVQDRQETSLRQLIHESNFKRFLINILVEHSDAEGVPIVYEDNPTYTNLLGRIEHESHMGVLSTNFTLIKGGAFHRANGGYLILDAHKVLMMPLVWETLKRALRCKEIRIQPMEQQLGLLATTTLEPEAVSLNLKIILIGDRRLYYLLKAFDPEVGQLFKVYCDFSEEITRDRSSVEAYARLIAFLSQQDNLKPLSAAATARVIEQAARYAGDGQKLSLHKGQLIDLLREADYWCRRQEADCVSAEHVQQAVSQRDYRQQQYQEKILEAIERDVLLIDVAGEKVGQVNGLSVIQLGDASFGRPSRITATARLGSGKLVDIERETELGGPIHSKGVLILASYLANRYAGQQPLSLSASLVFEQSYGPIEGDSASVAELCALLSAISGVPLQQRFAMTGSVNQMGQVQAIGGVNEKIEGFFAVCKSRGLSGEQGVIIPTANVDHLMLHQDVIDAVGRKQFHIYAVATLDEVTALLSGLVAGTADENGQFPVDSFNERVQRRLRALEGIRRDFQNHDTESESAKLQHPIGKPNDTPGRDGY